MQFIKILILGIVVNLSLLFAPVFVPETLAAAVCSGGDLKCYPTGGVPAGCSLVTIADSSCGGAPNNCYNCATGTGGSLSQCTVKINSLSLSYTDKSGQQVPINNNDLLVNTALAAGNAITASVNTSATDCNKSVRYKFEVGYWSGFGWAYPNDSSTNVQSGTSTSFSFRPSFGVRQYAVRVTVDGESKNGSSSFAWQRNVFLYSEVASTNPVNVIDGAMFGSITLPHYTEVMGIDGDLPQYYLLVGTDPATVNNQLSDVQEIQIPRQSLGWSNVTGSPLWRIDINFLNYQIPNLQPGTTYYWRLRQQGINTSAYIRGSAFTVPSVPTASDLPPTSEGEVIDQSNTAATSIDFAGAIAALFQGYQVFTPAVNGKLSKVVMSIGVRTTSTPCSGTLSPIDIWIAPYPGSLDTKLSDMATVVESQATGVITINFNAPATLTAATQYVLVFKTRDSQSSINCKAYTFAGQFNQNSTYSRGFLVLGSSGFLNLSNYLSTFGNPGAALYFATYMKDWTPDTTVHALPRIFDHGSFVFNSKLWVAGGNTDGVSRRIFFSSDGISWPQDGTLPTGDVGSPIKSERLGFVYFNDALWFVGNNNNSGSKINAYSSTTGGAWTKVSTLPQPAGQTVGDLVSYSALVFKGRIWILGGRFGDGLFRSNEIYSSPDGINWTRNTATAPYPGTLDLATVLVFPDPADNVTKMWVIGGAYNDAVYSSPDGDAWTRRGSLPVQLWLHSAVVFNNKMWVIGGYDNTNDVVSNKVYSSTDGINWTAEAILPAPTQEHTSVIFNGKVWVVGGRSPGDFNGANNRVYSSSNMVDWTLVSGTLYVPPVSAGVTPSVAPTPGASAPSGSDSGSGGVGTCVTSARWVLPAGLSSPVTADTEIDLEVSVTPECEGKQVEFKVWEDDGIFGSDPVETNPGSVTVSAGSNTITAKWTAEYQQDGFMGFTDPPEYYFEANIVGQTNKIRSLADLQVKLAGTIPDTLEYFISDHWQDKGLTGSHPLSQEIDNTKKRAYYSKWAEAGDLAGYSSKFELFTWDDTNVYLREDHSGSPVPYYSFSPGSWIKRKMQIGEKITTANNQIQVYDNSCQPTTSSGPLTTGIFPIETTLESHQQHFNIYQYLGQTYPGTADYISNDLDIIVIRYDTSAIYEKMYYSKEWGWILWEEYRKADNVLTNRSHFYRIEDTPLKPIKEAICLPEFKPAPTATPLPSSTPIPTTVPSVNGCRQDVLLAGMGSRVGDANFVAVCDFDNDGRIGAYDYSYLVSQLSTQALPPKPAACSGYGDVDGNGQINKTDMDLINAHLSTPSLNTDQQKRADVDGDNNITSQDYLSIESYLKNTLAVFVVCTPVKITNISSKSLNGGQIEISWKTQVPGTGEMLYGLSQTSLTETSGATSTYTTNHTAPLQNLQPGKIYFYKIRSTNGSGSVESPLRIFRTKSL